MFLQYSQLWPLFDKPTNQQEMYETQDRRGTRDLAEANENKNAQ